MKILMHHIILINYEDGQKFESTEIVRQYNLSKKINSKELMF